jgi:hypothetical protein
MDSQSEGGGGSSPGSPRSSSSSSSSRSDATGATTATQSTLLETTGCQQTKLNSEFNQLATYLAEEKAPKGLHDALKRICDAFKRVTTQAATDAIHSLQEAVQKLKIQIEAKPTGINALGPLGTSYAADAQQGAAGAAQSRMQGQTES